MRHKNLRIIVNLFLFAVAANLFYLQIMRGDTYYQLSMNNSIRVVPLEGPRGRILDRNGVVLADNRHSFDVTVIPQEIEDKDELFDFIAEQLRIDKNKLLQKFWQKRIAPFAPVIVAEDVTKEQAIAIEENKYRYSGVYVQESYNRYYPYHEVGAHVLGYVGRIDQSEFEELREGGYSLWSMIGKNGIEKFYNAYLYGQEGGLQIEVNSRGRQTRLLGVKDPQAGQDLQLTIDQRVQQMAYDALAGRRGVIIVMDLESGEILGLVSSPAYDPNIFVDSQLKSKAGSMIMDSQAPMINRAIKGLYPPGSVFKIAVSAAGLASNKLDPATSFNCDGVFNLGKSKFKCLHVHGPENLSQGITHSCNIYFYNVGQKVGPDVISHYAHLLGLGQPTDIDLPFEEKGLIPNPTQRRLKINQGWFLGDTLNMSIGQGDVLATPMQLLRMMATIGRNGREPQPYLLKSINHQEMVKLSTTHHVNLIPQVYDILQNALRLVVADPSGTAHALEIAGIKVAGKTGTAQAGHGRADHGSFIGYTLDTQPRVAICVFLENGGSSYNAVVLVKQILEKMRADQML